MESCRNCSSGSSTKELPGPATKTHEFLTGSSYEGEWQEGFGMHGYGVYTFLNGVIYEGEFLEGEFHGKGELRYQTPAGKAVIRGQWNKGVMTERTVVFEGALEYDAEDWQYCKMPDRRFTREYANDMQASGKSFMTANEHYIEVPEGFLDTGDGFYNPSLNKMIYDHDDFTKIIRGPALREQKWIQEHCRIGYDEKTIGPRRDLYEKYTKPSVLLEPVPPSPAKFTATKDETPFEIKEEVVPSFYSVSKLRADARLPKRKFQPSPN